MMQENNGTLHGADWAKDAALGAVVWVRDYGTALKNKRLAPFALTERKAREATRDTKWGTHGALLQVSTAPPAPLRRRFHRLLWLTPSMTVACSAGARGPDVRSRADASHLFGHPHAAGVPATQVAQRVQGAHPS